MNISGDPVSPFIAADYELKYLTSREIDDLLKLLVLHRSLGRLETQDLADRRAAFEFRAGRQLLVALHEATLGPGFEEIIEDEYRHIVPAEAQQLYLTICVLNRLGVPVRAGIVSRIHGIPFEEFKKRLFSPLELVVQAEYESVVRDYVYRARHPHIADIVFDRVLSRPDERYDAFIKCLMALNLDFSVDRRAFRLMVKARSLGNLFADPKMVEAIYKQALLQVGEEAFVYHQMGIYEMNRPGGNLASSGELLSRAQGLDPRDPTIRHSIAEHKLKSAEGSRTVLEKEKLLSEATEIAAHLKKDQRDNPYPYVTAVKVALMKLESALKATESDSVIEALIKEAERNLFDGLQMFPGDSYLLDAEANLAGLLSDSARVLSSLKKAFASNPRSGYLAARLAKHYKQVRNNTEAQRTLEKGLEANPSDQKLRYLLALVLLEQPTPPGDQIEYHLHRGFTEGDKNYDAQLLYGRQLFLNRKWDESEAIFQNLSKARVPSEVKNKPLHFVSTKYAGRVVKMETTYAFIAMDGSGKRVYAHQSNVGELTWEDLAVGRRVSFRLGFSFKGPSATEVHLEGR